MGLFGFLFRAVVRTTRRQTQSGRRQDVPQPARRQRPEPLLRQPDTAVWGELSGRVHVIDGDTIVIQRTKIRLAGVDAPELDQPWGQKSKWAMVEICRGQVVTARLNGERSHDRLVATCHLPDGRDIGAELIKQGLALDWAFFSGGRYRHLEPPGIRRKLRPANLRSRGD